MNDREEPPHSGEFNIKIDDYMSELKDFSTRNKKEAIAASFLILGVILSLFHSLSGGAVVGLVIGYYLSSEIKILSKAFVNSLSTHNKFKTLLLGCLFLTILFAIPSLVISAFAGIGIASLQDSR
jgi:hypothetical protein